MVGARIIMAQQERDHELGHQESGVQGCDGVDIRTPLLIFILIKQFPNQCDGMGVVSPQDSQGIN